MSTENSLKIQFEELTKLDLNHLSVSEVLDILETYFKEKIILSTSFSYEDQVISYFLKNRDIDIFTLDTGRLFEETYQTWTLTQAFLKKKIKAYYPDAEKIQEFVTDKGPDSFYQSVELRKKCCHIRKVEPLAKAIKGYSVWITGIRAEHSPNREHIQMLEWDETHQIIKIHPLLHWSQQQVLDCIQKNHIPYNPLHKKGYVSIGCAPCTRPIQEGEDFRAGRWWWEDPNKKECGLHVHQS
ncbi:phosphoadenylyl-sulfate reductase [Elizabethkingia sp. JS20170427COW]|uniref:phosphoadenylyl-sulfate reductase n=1 Tax=Elizabethkingia sp. JS20170427COW TaxID=2583851 RepID=UPI001110345E|nr:phosphoadenylyl-sulfate reductase [Elizabethkingia sp. JS20170427COW]QCX53563.1 phosphoadenylyl-sulfate reductase [Elizabethkingia sp. JS20170427COW]